MQAAIVEAGQAAVADALAWLEREAINVRRGTGNEAFLNDLAARDPEAAAAARIRSVPAHGVVAAAFRHRTSRAGDPLLHWHTLVANLAPGTGRTVDSVRASRPVPGRPCRRRGLPSLPTRRADRPPRPRVAPRPPRPRSRRRPRRAVRRCSPSAPSRSPTGSTPPARPTPPPAGKPRCWPPGAANPRSSTNGSTPHGKPKPSPRAGAHPKPKPSSRRSTPLPASVRLDRPIPPVDDTWIREVGRALTESDSTFTRPHLAQAVAARTPAGAPAATVDRLVAAVLADPSIVPVNAGTGPRWTTTDLLAIERRFLDTAATSVGTRAPVPAATVETHIAAASSLGDDQAAAVRALAASTDGVTVLVGPAGTGKTFTLDTLRAAHQAAGHHVIGAAPSARAAHELATDAHIPASTLHRLLGSWTRGHERPGPTTVLVIDEAAMAGIRELETAVSTVIAAGGRVVLVGDHHQLPEVTAGGGFAALATNSDLTVAQLSVNRRQHQAWEIDALAQLRNGHVPAAVDAYRTHGRVVVTDDRTTMLTEAVDRWQAARATGHDPVLIAGTNATVRALNDAVRTRLRNDGHLAEPAGTWTDRTSPSATASCSASTTTPPPPPPAPRLTSSTARPQR